MREGYFYRKILSAINAIINIRMMIKIAVNPSESLFLPNNSGIFYPPIKYFHFYYTIQIRLISRGARNKT